MHTLANDSDGMVEETVAQPSAIVGTSPPSYQSSLVRTLILNPPIRRVMNEPDLQLQECMLFDR